MDRYFGAAVKPLQMTSSHSLPGVDLHILYNRRLEKTSVLSLSCLDKLYCVFRPPQGEGGRRQGGFVDQLQRGRWQNGYCYLAEYERNKTLVFFFLTAFLHDCLTSLLPGYFKQLGQHKGIYYMIYTITYTLPDIFCDTGVCYFALRLSS